MEKIKGRSTQDTNALGAQHIKEAFFFRRRLFEWDMFFLFYPLNWERVVKYLTLVSI